MTLDKTADELWMDLAQAKSDGDPRRVAELLRALRAHAEAALSAGRPEARRLLASVCFGEGTHAIDTGRPADAERHLTAALRHAEAALANDPATVDARGRVATAHCSLGNLYADQRRHDDAARSYRAALPLLEANAVAEPAEPEHRNALASARFNLGNILLESGRAHDAGLLFLAARDLWQPLVAAEPDVWEYAHDLARSEFNLAFAATRVGATDEALDAYARAQATWARLVHDDAEHHVPRYDLARCLHNGAILLSEMGRHEESVTALDQAVAHFDRLLAQQPGDPHLTALRRQSQAQRELVVAQSPRRRADGFLTDADREAAAARDAGDVRRLRDLVARHLHLAAELGRAGDSVEMERVYAAAIARADEAAARDASPESAHLAAAACFDLHLDLRGMNRYDGAETAVRAAMRRWSRLAAQHPGDPRFPSGLAATHNGLGIVMADTGRLESAATAYRAAIALREVIARTTPDDGDNLLYLGGARCNLGGVTCDLGRRADARAHYDEARRTLEAARGRASQPALWQQFVQNTRDGVASCDRADAEPERTATAMLGGPCGFDALTFAGCAPSIAEALRRVDALRRAGDPDAEPAARAWTERADDCPEAWLEWGLTLGGFDAPARDAPTLWNDARHVAATTALHEAEVRRPGYYDARLARGLALRWAAHAAQSQVRAMRAAVASTYGNAREAREAQLALAQRRFSADVARAKEALERAARLRPNASEPLYALAELVSSLDGVTAAGPYLARLRRVDVTRWAQAREALGDTAP